MIRLIALLLCLSVTPVTALDRNLPALFNVTGVASDDVLNARSGPGLSFETTGGLQHDRRNVEIVAVDESGLWGLTNVGEQAQWVSMRFLALQPDQIEGAFPEFLSCFGTEPFWNIEITGSNVIM
ncbi:MAG: peptide-binding protein, partial [Planktomarina sp.]